jgi:hypothetical protein
MSNRQPFAERSVATSTVANAFRKIALSIALTAPSQHESQIVEWEVAVNQ